MGPGPDPGLWELDGGSAKELPRAAPRGVGTGPIIRRLGVGAEVEVGRGFETSCFVVVVQTPLASVVRPPMRNPGIPGYHPTVGDPNPNPNPNWIQSYP